MILYGPHSVRMKLLFVLIIINHLFNVYILSDLSQVWYCKEVPGTGEINCPESASPVDVAYTINYYKKSFSKSLNTLNI